MQVKVKTRSNYRSLNGQWLDVKEIQGTRVTCLVVIPGLGLQTVDFVLREVTEFNYQAQSPLEDLLKKIDHIDPTFRIFRKYVGLDQKNKNDYEVGCIQTANALMPVLTDLLLKSRL